MTPETFSYRPPARQMYRSLALLACMTVGGALAADETHCRPGETVAFSCRVGQKVASACASADYSDKKGYFSYRFGTIGKVEIELPKDRWKGGATEARREIFGNGGESGYLRFWNGPTAYVLFHSSQRDGNRGWIESAGVAVENKGKRNSLLRCAGGVQSKLLDAKLMEKTWGFMDNSEAEGFDFP